MKIATIVFGDGFHQSARGWTRFTFPIERSGVIVDAISPGGTHKPLSLAVIPGDEFILTVRYDGAVK